MVEQQLGNFLIEEGYSKIPSNLPEFTIYFRPENNYVNVFHVIDYQKNLYITEDQYKHIKEKIISLFMEKGISDVHILSLVICSDMEKVRQICQEDPFCWMIDPYSDRLIIYENQAGDFYGMRAGLEYFLSHICAEAPQQDFAAGAASNTPRKFSKGINNIPFVTAAVVFLNILVFLICTFTGDLLYNIGAFNAADFLERKEYYRIFTSMFLHWDINHLVSNMVVLYYLGEVVEKHFGRLGYMVLYLTTGLCGNLLSLVYELYTDAQINSVGASGAIFGIIGALLVLVILHRGRLDQITVGRLLFMISYSLYSGFVGSNINNAAHIGGFLSGIAAAFVLWILIKYKRKEKSV